MLAGHPCLPLVWWWAQQRHRRSTFSIQSVDHPLDTVAHSETAWATLCLPKHPSSLPSQPRRLKGPRLTLSSRHGAVCLHQRQAHG